MTSAEREGVRIKRWTREEFEQAVRIFYEQRLELIDGGVMDKKGEEPSHDACMERMADWLNGVFSERRVLREARIDVAPADNPANEPAPDFVALKRTMNYFLTTNPGPEDILLVVEVAGQRTLRFDLKAKGALYARAGIPEYWLADVAGRRLGVLREPRDGQYQLGVAYDATESVAPLAAPESFLRVADLFTL